MERTKQAGQGPKGLHCAEGPGFLSDSGIPKRSVEETYTLEMLTGANKTNSSKTPL